jgi:hypothetical protein
MTYLLTTTNERKPYRATERRLIELRDIHPERLEYYRALTAALATYTFTSALAITGKSTIKTEVDAVRICSQLHKRLMRSYYGRQLTLGDNNFPMFMVIENHRSSKQGYHLHILLGQPAQSFRIGEQGRNAWKRQIPHMNALHHLRRIRFGGANKQKLGEIRHELIWDQEGAVQYALKNLTIKKFIAVYEHSTVHFDRVSHNSERFE